MDYVAKGTPPGYDVKTAADYLLSFNSEWPLLKVHDTGNYSGAVNHNLGYPPFHFLASTFVPGAIDELSDTYGVDSSVLERSSGSGSPRYYIFRLDLTQNFTAPILSSDVSTTPKNDDYVFKMTKPGKDTSSTDMRDFALHSNTRSPMVHKVSHGTMTGTPENWYYTVPHGLTYVPTVFPFIKPNANSAGLNPNRYFIVPPPIGVGIANYIVDATNVIVFGGTLLDSAPQCSVVVLKDPFLKQVINVSFP